MNIRLPISKSIANRLLLLQAIHGDPLYGVPKELDSNGVSLRVSADMPDDVRVLHDALQALRQYRSVQSAKSVNEKEPLTLYLKNCGTALRFLEVHLAQCYPGEPITLTGDARLMERKGKPTTQTTSALILHGVNVPVEANESPYITMSRKMAQAYQPSLADIIERDWSAAAFWYEYVAIHGGELLLDGLTDNSLQGDRIVADIYAEHFGVQTEFTPNGAVIRQSEISNQKSAIDFINCPDLYPAIALTCERLGITLHATGTERLAYKECNRLEAVARHETRHDHRMAMALLAAGFVVDDTDCIAKSYPEFLKQLQAVAAHFERG